MDSPIQQCSIFCNIPVNMAIEYFFKAGPDRLQQKRFSGFSAAFSKKKKKSAIPRNRLFKQSKTKHFYYTE